MKGYTLSSKLYNIVSLLNYYKRDRGTETVTFVTYMSQKGASCPMESHKEIVVPLSMPPTKNALQYTQVNYVLGIPFLLMAKNIHLLAFKKSDTKGKFQFQKWF